MWRAPLFVPAVVCAGIIWLLHPVGPVAHEGQRVRAACVVTSDVRDEGFGRAFTCTFNANRSLDVTLKDEKIVAGERLLLAGKASQTDVAKELGGGAVGLRG